MNPFGGTTLEQLHRFGDGYGGGQRKQNVDMILYTANFEGLHFVLPGNTSEKWPEPFAQFRFDRGMPFFGAEDTMEIGADVGHKIHSAVPAELMQCRILYPQLKLRAIFISSRW